MTNSRRLAHAMRLLIALLLLAPSLGLANAELALAALARTDYQVTYDGSYRRIDYPGGDVPEHIGVCSDLVVRAYRRLDVDLQLLVHEDMAAHFDAYPNHWGLTQPDPNIDHRRVPNLERFFARQGTALTPTQEADRYLPGDIVTWRLNGSLPHIGIVGPNIDSQSNNPLIIHNIGQGPKEEDVLFSYPINGHYRFSQ